MAYLYHGSVRFLLIGEKDEQAKTFHVSADSVKELKDLAWNKVCDLNLSYAHLAVYQYTISSTPCSHYFCLHGMKKWKIQRRLFGKANKRPKKIERFKWNTVEQEW